MSTKLLFIYLLQVSDSFNHIQDKNLVLSGLKDGKILVWDISNQKIIHELIGHSRIVNSVKISQDGVLALSSSSDNTVRLWDLEDANCLNIQKHDSIVKQAVFAHFNNLVITASYDAIIRIFSTFTNELVKTQNGHFGVLNMLSINDNLLVSGADDGTARLWNVPSPLDANQIPISDTGQLIVRSKNNSDTKCKINKYINNLQSKRKCKKHDDIVENKQEDKCNKKKKINSECINEDYIEDDCDDDNNTKVKDQEPHIFTFETNEHSIISVALSQDNKLVTFAGTNGYLFLADVNSKTIIKHLHLHESFIFQIKFIKDIKDNTLITTAGLDNQVIFQDQKTDEKVDIIQKDKTNLYSISVSENGKYYHFNGSNHEQLKTVLFQCNMSNKNFIRFKGDFNPVSSIDSYYI